MPQTEPKSNFDIDLDFGQIWERRICNIFENNGSLEVKADRMWWNSGNLAFEYKCNGKPSGIAASKAIWWVSVLTCQDDPENTEMILIWKTEKLRDKLRQLIKEKRAELKTGGDGNKAQLVITSIDELLPDAIHDKPWSARKEIYQKGYQKGVADTQQMFTKK
tara:strand:- start:1744 stop:2232 length:489 start_codon:yes stop_codon:yes gene_type:complete